MKPFDRSGLAAATLAGLLLCLAAPAGAGSSSNPDVIRLRACDQQPVLSGKTEKYMAEDDLGQKYILKVFGPRLAHRTRAAEAADEVLRKVGLPAPVDRLVKLDDDTYGHLILFVPCKGNLERTAVTDLTSDQRQDLVRNHPVDWLLGNYDTHSGQFLVAPDDRLLAIDKDLSFKMYEKGLLNEHFELFAGSHSPVYNTLYQAYERGRLDLDLAAAYPVIERAQALDDPWLCAKIAPFAVQRLFERGATAEEVLGSRKHQRKVLALLNQVLRRKASLYDDFARFHRSLARQRGATFEPPPPGPANGRFRPVVRFDPSWAVASVPRLELDNFESIRPSLAEHRTARLRRNLFVDTPFVDTWLVAGSRLGVLKGKVLDRFAKKPSPSPDEPPPVAPPSGIDYAGTSAAFEALHGRLDQAESFDAAADAAADDEEPAPPGAIETDVAFRWARMLMSAAGVPEVGHWLMRNNLACYLAQGGHRGHLTRTFEHLTPGQRFPLRDLNLSPRFENKLARDLRAPYTDAEVLAHVRVLEGQVRKVFEAARTTGGSVSMLVMGSFARGRLGANSDLDCYYLTKDPATADAIRALPFAAWELATKAEVNFCPAPKAMTGPKLDLGDGRFLGLSDDPFVDLYRSVLFERFGLAVRKGADGALTCEYLRDGPSRELWRRETNRFFEAVWNVGTDLRHIGVVVRGWFSASRPRTDPANPAP